MEDEFALWRSLDEITVTQAAYLWCGLIPPDTPHVIDSDRPETYHIRPQIAHMTLGKLNKAIDAEQLRLSKNSHQDFKLLSVKSDDSRIYKNPERYVVIEELRRFALAIGEKPIFLFQTPDQMPDAKSEKVVQVKLEAEVFPDAGEERSPEKIANVQDIVIELENDDQVKIRVPGESVTSAFLTSLGFKTTNTAEANALKGLLEHGKFIRKGDSGARLVRRINRKLREYFGRSGIALKPESKFISLKAPGSGYFIPEFKTKVPEFRSRKNFDKKLAWAKRECDLDKQLETVNQALADGVISKEEAKSLYENLKNTPTDTILDPLELTVKGGFNIKGPRTA